MVTFFEIYYTNFLYYSEFEKVLLYTNILNNFATIAFYNANVRKTKTCHVYFTDFQPSKVIDTIVLCIPQSSVNNNYILRLLLNNTLYQLDNARRIF